MESVTEQVGSRLDDRILDYLWRETMETGDSMRGRSLSDAIYIINAASGLATHEERFNRLVETYRQG